MRTILICGLVDEIIQLLKCSSGYYAPEKYVDELEEVVSGCSPPLQ